MSFLNLPKDFPFANNFLKWPFSKEWSLWDSFFIASSDIYCKHSLALKQHFPLLQTTRSSVKSLMKINRKTFLLFFPLVFSSPLHAHLNFPSFCEENVDLINPIIGFPWERPAKLVELFNRTNVTRRMLRSSNLLFVTKAKSRISINKSRETIFPTLFHDIEPVEARVKRLFVRLFRGFSGGSWIMNLLWTRNSTRTMKYRSSNKRSIKQEEDKKFGNYYLSWKTGFSMQLIIMFRC